MKKIILSALFLAFGTTAIFAETENKSTTETVYILQDEKTPIKLEALPDSVKATLAGEEFKEWTASEAFVVTPKEGAKHFEVVLKNAEEQVAVVKFGEDGKVIEVPVVEDTEEK